MSGFDQVEIALDFQRLSGRRTRSLPAWHGCRIERFFWPAFYWHVHVRERRVRGLNLFQDYALRLSETGLRDPGRLGAILLPPSNAMGSGDRRHRFGARLIAELQEMGAFDAAGGLTPLGRDMLHGAKRESEELVSRYVFADPWTGAIWSRFPDAILSAVTDPPRLDDPGGPGTRDICVVYPGAVPVPDPPSHEDIRQCFATYLRDWSIADGADETEDRERDADDRDTPTSIGDIVHVGESGRPVFLQTFAFLPSDRRDGALWRVADPFGLGVNAEFRTRVDAVSRDPNQSVFFAWLQSTFAPDRTGMSGGNLSEDAEQKLDEEIGGRLAAHPRLHDDLLSAQRATLVLEAARRDVEALEKDLHQTARVATPAERFRFREANREIGDSAYTAINKAQVALEWLFKIIDDRFPARYAYGVFNLIGAERRDSAEELTRIALSLGFSGDQDGKLPDRLTYVDPNKIRSAADHRRGSLNSLVWASLLQAKRGLGDGHPLAKASIAYPDLLLDLSMVAEMRDNVSHAVADPSDYADDVPLIVAKTRRIVALLLPSSLEHRTPELRTFASDSML